MWRWTGCTGRARPRIRRLTGSPRRMSARASRGPASAGAGTLSLCLCRPLLGSRELLSSSEHLSYGIYGLALRFMVDPREHLPQKSHDDELHAEYHHEDAKEEKRPSPYALAHHELLEAQIERDEEANEAEQEPAGAEGVDRRRGEALEELNGDEVEDDPYCPRYAVLGFAELPRAVVCLDLRDGRAHPARYGRDEAVHLPVEAHVLFDLFPVRL